MKKLAAILLALFVICAAACAEGIDLSGMSFDDLLALRQRVDEAIWNSDGWQSVTVPGGVYVIGEDIPAGRWSVAADGLFSSLTLYPSKADYTAQEYNYITMQALTEDQTYTLECADGNCIEINGGLVFTPYTGAALGFK